MAKITHDIISRLGKRLFGNKAEPPLVQVAPDEEIPRYPPFMKGLPAASVERLLESQTELINAIEQALALPDDLYRNIAAPVIARYAAFSHLLPASESHHHRGAGGLFRHGLEVAHWATLASQGCLFATDATPRERKALEVRWRLAVCFAGLLHDIGKPVSDMAVIDRHGKHTWNPCDENLNDWAAQHGIDRYFLRWRENRHKRHEQFSALVIERVLTRESRTYILELGPEIMQAMLEAIHGLDRGAKLYELVLMADRKSVERDLKNHYHNVDSALGMPIEKYLFDAMRRLIKSGQWRANEKGARLWRFQEGLHIVWRSGAQDIVDTLAKDKVPGIPRDEDTLADILIERGLAIPRTLADGRHYRYWRIQPQGLNVTLYMLRLSSLELVYSGEPPVAIEGIEVDEDSALSLSEEITTEATQVEPAHGQLDIPDMKSPQDQQANLAVPDLLSPVQNTAIAVQSLPNQPEVANTDSTQIDHVISTTSKSKDDGNNSKTHKSTAEIDKISNALGNNSLTGDSRISVRRWLNGQGQAGEWLLQITAKINQGEWHCGTDLVEIQDKWLLPFPATPEKLNIDPNLFINVLNDKGWLVTDVLTPMRKVQLINQVRGVLLASEPSAKIRQLLAKDHLPVSITSQPVKSKVPATSKPPKDKTLSSKKDPSNKQPVQMTMSGNGQQTVVIAKKTISKPPVLELSPATEMTENLKITTNGDAVINSLPANQFVLTLVEQVQQTRLVTKQTNTESAWSHIEDAVLDQYLKLHPSDSRSNLLREFSRHPDCRLVDGCIQVHIKS